MSGPTSAGETLVPSPCVGICDLDPATGWCLGCGRGGDELFGWGDLTPAKQQAIWAELPARMAQLRRPMRLLPWTGPSLLGRLRELTGAPDTCWSFGMVGASGEFLASPDATIDVAAGDDPKRLGATHPGGRLAITSVAGLRGLVRVPSDGGADDAVEITLALHEARLKRPPARTVVDLGPDRDALEPGQRDARLFDLGLGCPWLRFCVRTLDPELVGALRRAAGTPLLDAPELLGLIATVSPPRVLANTIGRLEVWAPIPPPDGASPEGPHTHLYPSRLRGVVPTPLGSGLPEGYVPMAQVFVTAAAARAVGLGGD